jgi:Replication-relaxation
MTGGRGMTARHRATGAGPARPRSRTEAVPDLAELAGRLTERDRELCRLVLEHRVLTSLHCAQLVFASPVTARHRLVILTGLRVLDRFRPTWQLGQGSPPWHYVLGPAGAAVLAAERGVSVAELGWRRDRTLSIAHSPQLAHQVGVNGFFAALAAHARRRRDAALLAWWPERRCAERWGQLVRPDGYGRWRQAGAEVDFFLEYDRGTEDLGRLLAKLDGYAELAAVSGIATPVLWWLPSPGREASFRAPAARPGVPVATATAQAGAGPAGPVWLPLPAEPGGQRVPLAALAGL